MPYPSPLPFFNKFQILSKKNQIWKYFYNSLTQNYRSKLLVTGQLITLLTSHQTPINCILQGDGCPNLLTSYFTKYTAICPSCQVSMKSKLLSSPFSPDLCPCCHQASNSLPYSLCSECLESIQEGGYTDSSWGSWHLERIT